MMQTDRKIITRLTALWAISESGLGGFMHALKIPFTGFFLGGFAIVIITIIAAHSNSRWKDILQATLVVMLIKAVASPHSPPMAYLAVAFQGAAGTLIYAISVNKPSAALFGMIALAESALQKLIVLTLIFGKNIWEALDAFFNGIVKDLHLDSNLSFSLLLVIAYAGAYVIWGAIAGWWSAGITPSLNARSHDILTQFSDLEAQKTGLEPTVKKKVGRYLFLFITLLFILAVFFFQERFNKMGYVVLRTVAAIFLLYGILNPIIKWAINRWLQKKEDQHKKQVSEIMALLPELRSYLKPAMLLARKNHKGLAVYTAFIINWIILSLYRQP